jgi:hypothetical protein
MIFDAVVSFVPLNAPLSLVGGSGVVIPSTNVVDLLGQGVGTAPANIIGTKTVFGTDMGVGGKRPELNVTVGVGLTGSVGQQLKVALQGAVDQGVAGNYQPGTWVDIVSQDGIALANVSGGAKAGSVIFRCPWIPTFPPGLQPRYLRLLFSPMTVTALPSGDFTAGTIASALVTMVRDDWAAAYAAKNFTVA